MTNLVLELMPVVPQTYGEAIEMYPWLMCESHEWDNRTTVENAVYLIRHLTSRLSGQADNTPKSNCGHIFYELNCPNCQGARPLAP